MRRQRHITTTFTISFLLVIVILMILTFVRTQDIQYVRAQDIPDTDTPVPPTSPPHTPIQSTTPAHILIPVLPPPPLACSVAPNASNQNINIRFLPSVDAPKHYAFLPFGWFEIIDTAYDNGNNIWYKIKFVGLDTAWVKGSLVQLSQPDCANPRPVFQCDDVINVAARHLPIYTQWAYRDDCNQLSLLTSFFPPPGWEEALLRVPNLWEWHEKHKATCETPNMPGGIFIELIYRILHTTIAEQEEINQVMLEEDSCEKLKLILSRPFPVTSTPPPQTGEPIGEQTETPEPVVEATLPNPVSIAPWQPPAVNLVDPSAIPSLIPVIPSLTPTLDPSLEQAVAVFIRGQQGGSANQLYMLRNRQVNLVSTDLAGLHMHPALDPDGRFVAYFLNTDNGLFLLLAETTSGKIQHVLPNGNLPIASSQPGPIAWSPDGDLFVTLIENDTPNIYQIDLQQQRSGLWKENASYPTFSIDGRFAAYISNKDGSENIFVTDHQRDDAERDILRGSPLCDQLTNPTFDLDRQSSLYFVCHGGSSPGLYKYADDLMGPQRLEISTNPIDHLLAIPGRLLTFDDGNQIYLSEINSDLSIARQIPLDALGSNGDIYSSLSMNWTSLMTIASLSATS